MSMFQPIFVAKVGRWDVNFQWSYAQAESYIRIWLSKWTRFEWIREESNCSTKPNLIAIESLGSSQNMKKYNMIEAQGLEHYKIGRSGTELRRKRLSYIWCHTWHHQGKLSYKIVGVTKVTWLRYLSTCRGLPHWGERRGAGQPDQIMCCQSRVGRKEEGRSFCLRKT